jgi:hypothetical protein
MAEIALPSTPTSPNPRRALHFEWLIPVLIRPRKAFAEIAAQTRGVWLVPILLLTLCTLLSTLMGGYVKQSTGALGGGIEVPQDSFYTPEQQAQFAQASEALNGPFFVYVLPALGALIAVWLGWLIFGGILHLILTLMGGRSTTGVTMNVVAWASLPLAIRGLVQFFYLLIFRQPITGLGFSGFIPADSPIPLMICGAFLALLDIYLIWQIILLVIGVRASSALTIPRAIVSVFLGLAAIMFLQTILTFGGSMFTNLSVIPFF